MRILRIFCAESTSLLHWCKQQIVLRSIHADGGLSLPFSCIDFSQTPPARTLTDTETGGLDIWSNFPIRGFQREFLKSQ